MVPDHEVIELVFGDGSLISIICRVNSGRGRVMLSTIDVIRLLRGSHKIKTRKCPLEAISGAPAHSSRGLE